MIMNEKNPFGSLCLLLVIKAVAILLFILYGGIGLGPDEAQYWTWSKSLDFGYYSKPPGIAWEIWAGTYLFGDTELGVRFGAILVGTFLPLAVYALARACGLQKNSAFWSGAIMAISPLGILSSFLAITDGGIVLFWTLACLFLGKAIENKTAPNYILIGLMVMFGALFKWQIYILWLIIFAGTLFYPILRQKLIFAGIAISLLGLLPSVIWNRDHEWATFRHVFATIEGGATHEQQKGNFGAFLGEQVALLSPILFILYLAGILSLFTHRKAPPSVRFFGLSSFAIIACYTVQSLFHKMQGNWCVFAYPMAAVFLGWYACDFMKRGIAWLIAGLTLSAVLSVLVFALPYVQKSTLVDIPYKWNMFRHNLGWNQLSKALARAGYDPKRDFLFGDKYQTSSILSFYGPEQNRAYFFNIHGIRKNQFSFWPGMDAEQKGKTGFYVLFENQPQLDLNRDKIIESSQKLLEPYFANVRFKGEFPLFLSNDQVAKAVFIFLCEDYNGKLPQVSLSY